MSSSNRSSYRSPAIDVVKGVAIMSVICLHSLSGPTLHRIGALFFISQAVPVFVFLMGVNGVRSLRRRSARTGGAIDLWEYMASRLDRVLVPFLVVFVVGILAEAFKRPGRLGLSTLMVDLITGKLPIGGPGSYFVTLLFQLTLVLPLLFWGLRRWPLATVLLCLAINAAFEQLVHIGFGTHNPYAYEASVTRYLFLFSLGGALADSSIRGRRRSLLLWCGGLVSVAFLMLAQFDAAAVSVGLPGFEGSAYPAAFYPALLVSLAIVAPASLTSGRIARAVAEAGRASYHIFLIQINWFGLALFGIDSLQAVLANLAVTLLIGVAFYRVMLVLPLPSASGLLARHRATLAARRLRPVS